MTADNIYSDSTAVTGVPREEFLDAVERHICQVLGFDYGFIDIVSGHDIVNLVDFTAAERDEQTIKLVQELVDENKQPLAVANTLVAQKVKSTQRPWVGRAFARASSNEKRLDENELPYAIVPVMSDASAKSGIVKGLIRVVCFDSSREISTQDLTTLRLMGEHLANRTQLFFEAQSENALSQVSKNSEADPAAADRDQILVLHGNRVLRRRFTRILSDRYRIFECDSEEKSLSYLSENRVDLIIVDSNLSGTSGFGFCKMIKDSPQWKHIPVLIVTPDSGPSARVEALSVGADDCLTDSCFDTELAARVQSSLRHRRIEKELAVQLELLEDYAQRLEKAHEQLSQDRQSQMQRNTMLEQLRRESDILRNQESLLHRISNTIRRSFNIKENLTEMLEELSGYFALDCCFLVLPSEEEPEDSIRVEYVTDESYKVIDYDRDLATLELYSKLFAADQAIIVNDVANDRRLDAFRSQVLSGYNILSLFYVPVHYSEKLLGLLVGFKGEVPANWNRVNEAFMKSVADQVASGVTNARLYARVQRQATTDGLTTLFNHRTGQEKLTEQMRMAERYQRHLSVLMVDVDHFKSINDNYGHPVGDTVLKAVARLIKNNCRDVDIPIRYGGEEFMLVLPEVNREGAHVVAERIRKSLSQEVIQHDNIALSVTASLGIATFPDDAMEQHVLLKLADNALYMSKRMGRNQVHTADELQGAGQPAPPPTRSENFGFDVDKLSEAARESEELSPEVVEMVKALAGNLYSRSDYNKIHHLEVARLSELLGKVMGLSSTQIEQIRVAGLLHDVGTLRLPDELLNKQGTYTAEERKVVNQHSYLGAEMLRPVKSLKEICEILENHHERWDGTGFPRGLRGEDIPLPARIVSIVDSYHAMISARPYRQALTVEEAISTLRAGAGRQWDPFLVDIFIAVLSNIGAAL
ncbi:MAG TPA: diguanylate cyclase [Candidatus Obscuribacter sp.]|nr:diguanylate cyclase [Candidatus Obscuribacter sp.]HNH73953.1 diguanylate cyclase [Candidatus Obscuribacter sp.]